MILKHRLSIISGIVSRYLLLLNVTEPTLSDVFEIFSYGRAEE